MITEKQMMRAAVTAFLMSLATAATPVLAQAPQPAGGAETQSATEPPAEQRESTAMKRVDDAVAVVSRMGNEPRMKELLANAKGIFIVPTYGRAALGVGASGGAGVLLVKADGTHWSEPVFYNMGGISAGAQAGAEGGAIAMVLNNQKAVDRFMQKNAFSLSADAGLTVINWAKIAQGSVGTGDVVVWSGTKGLYGNVVALGINDIRFNQTLTDAYYHLNLSPRDVITGRVRNPQADSLKQALLTTSSSTASGASPSGSEGSGKPSGNK
jgi:lipid-binding SYLF domain-containing protein